MVARLLVSYARCVDAFLHEQYVHLRAGFLHLQAAIYIYICVCVSVHQGKPNVIQFYITAIEDKRKDIRDGRLEGRRKLLLDDVKVLEIERGRTGSPYL